MTDFLIKKFIRNPDAAEDARVRVSYGVLGSAVGIGCNLILFIIKCVAGLSVHSVAILADAFNNLSDMASSIISLISVRASSKPADREHPFGHGRLEYIAALVVSFVIINVGLSFFREAIGKIRQPEALHYSGTALILLLLSIAVKLWMARFNRNLSLRIHSEILRATATDSLFDAITTAITLASLMVYVWFGVNIDGIASLIVSVIIIWAGIGVARDTLSPLIGQQMDPNLAQKLTALVEEDPSIIRTHDLIIHSYGPSRFMATIHIEVPSRMTLEAAHTVANAAEKKAMREMGILLVVHVDPAEVEDERAIRIREQLTRLLNILDPDLTFHDLQIEFREDARRIQFDLVVPYRYKAEDERRISTQITALMRELDEKNRCEITIDRGAIEDYVPVS